MIIIRHTEECASKPDRAGRMTGTCDCKTAGLDESAQRLLEQLLDQIAKASIAADEPADYLALRLDELAELVAKAARNVRRRAQREAAEKIEA